MFYYIYIDFLFLVNVIILICCQYITDVTDDNVYVELHELTEGLGQMLLFLQCSLGKQ